jgi:nucleoside-diphosphate-sugar epimerase
MRAFVTGGTGFIGKRVVRQLVERDYEVVCLARSPEQAVHLRELGAALVAGDVTDQDSMRQGMSGADVVFHLAAWHESGLPPSADGRMERINVGGADNVLGLAVELGVHKIIYTSTVSALGYTHGMVVDETYHHDGSFHCAYDRTKHQAHHLAQQYMAQGAPVIIVMPGAVYGPGDPGLLSALWRLLLRRMLPVLPGADVGLSFVYVDDVARGHILAAERGRVGQSYLLGGDALTIGDAAQITARLAGVPAPLLFVDSRLVIPLRSLMRWAEKFVTLPLLFNSELARWLGTTWWVSSARAERELGYTHRSFEEGMAETISWEAIQLQGQLELASARRTWLWLALAPLTLVLGVVLLWGRRRRE